MTDLLSHKKRSEIMSRIRSCGNRATELRLIAIFRKFKITGWRRGQRLTGKPDFVFRKQRVVVFVDGCFWHDCPQHGSKPKTNATFWSQKLIANKIRDKWVTNMLRRQGWRVLRIWEHELAGRRESNLLARLLFLRAAVTFSSRDGGGHRGKRCKAL